MLREEVGQLPHDLAEVHLEDFLGWLHYRLVTVSSSRNFIDSSYMSAAYSLPTG